MLALVPLCCLSRDRGTISGHGEDDGEENGDDYEGGVLSDVVDAGCAWAA